MLHIAEIAAIRVPGIVQYAFPYCRYIGIELLKVSLESLFLLAFGRKRQVISNQAENLRAANVV